MSTKEDRIRLCGKRTQLRLKANGIMAASVMYCNYYYECPTCSSREKRKRSKIISDMIEDNSFNKLFRAVVSNDDWEALTKQMRRKGIEYIRVPQDENFALVYATDIPYKNNNTFFESTHREAIDELTKPENLFCSHGIRSTSKGWKLTTKGEQYSDSVEIHELVPAFVPTKKFGKSITLDVTNALYLHASTWKYGNVTLDNVQEYSNYRTNKAISLALAQGMEWDMSLTKIRTRTIGKEQAERWKIAHVSPPNLTVMGSGDNPFANDIEYLLQINEIDPEDHIAKFKEWASWREVDEYDPVEILFGSE